MEALLWLWTSTIKTQHVIVRFMRCHISVQKLWQYNLFWNLCLSLKKKKNHVSHQIHVDARGCRWWGGCSGSLLMFESTAQWISTGWNSQQIFPTKHFYQNVQLDMCQKVKMEAKTTKEWASRDSTCYNSKTLMRLRKRSENHWWCCANWLTKVRALFSFVTQRHVGTFLVSYLSLLLNLEI